MAKTQRAAVAPVASGADWPTASELLTQLGAVCEALIPSAPAPEGERDDAGLYARAASDLSVAQLMAEALGQQSPQSQADFKQLLGTLGSPVGGLLVAGRPRSLTSMPLAARQAALRRMSTHRMARLRQGFQALKRLCEATFYTAPGPDGLNPNWQAIGYIPSPPPPSPEQAPKRIKPLAITQETTLTADAVVVGSGAGGALIAADLAAAGKSVLVLEKGGYFNEADFTGREAEMTQKLFLRQGLLSTSDLGLLVLAGSCLGGGTVVNWSTSLRTPPEVLEEWEREHGLTGVTSADSSRASTSPNSGSPSTPATARPTPTTRRCSAAARG